MEGYDAALDDDISESDLNEHRPQSAARCHARGDQPILEAIGPRAHIEDAEAGYSARQAVLAFAVIWRNAMRSANSLRPSGCASSATALVDRGTMTPEVVVRDAAYWMKGCSSLGRSPLRRASRGEKAKNPTTAACA